VNLKLCFVGWREITVGGQRRVHKRVSKKPNRQAELRANEWLELGTLGKLWLDYGKSLRINRIKGRRRVGQGVTEYKSSQRARLLRVRAREKS